MHKDVIRRSDGKTKKDKKEGRDRANNKHKTSSHIYIYIYCSMSSWWVIDNTTDTKRTETDGRRDSVNRIEKKGDMAKKGHINVTIR